MTPARSSATSSSRTLDGVRARIWPGLVTARQVLTPLDLERDYGLTGGHPLHAEPGLDQFFLWRPLLGHARYRLALDGLYLAGAGAHPGRRDHRPERPERCARDRRGPEAPSALGASTRA